MGKLALVSSIACQVADGWESYKEWNSPLVESSSWGACGGAEVGGVIFKTTATAPRMYQGLAYQRHAECRHPEDILTHVNLHDNVDINETDNSVKMCMEHGLED